jgi:hypothetical protein
MAKTSPDTYPRVSASRPNDADPSSDGDSKLTLLEASSFPPTKVSDANPDPTEPKTISAAEYDFPCVGEANWEYMERVLFKRKRLSPGQAFQRLESRKQNGQQRG